MKESISWPKIGGIKTDRHGNGKLPLAKLLEYFSGSRSKQGRGGGRMLIQKEGDWGREKGKDEEEFHSSLVAVGKTMEAEGVTVG